MNLIILGLMLGLNAEVRSLWVLPWNMQSSEAIDKVIADAVFAQQNEILLEVRYRSDALYTPNRLNSKYANPEPRSYILADDGFDPLAYAIEKARIHQIKVQAWVIVFNATPLLTELVQENYIYRNHPEWITYNQQNERMRSSKQFGYFIDPGIPEVQDYLLDVFSDIVSGYPELYGLHLDYIRYPDATWGYHPISKQRYASEGTWLTWNQWRTQQITEFVGKCRDRIKSINPDIMLSAAVFADIDDARNQYAQDWYSWLQQGLIDRAYPMAYQMNDDIFASQMRQMSQQGDPATIVMGIRAWDAQGKSLLDAYGKQYGINDVVKRIKLIREYGFAGIALFSYEGLRVGNALQYLADVSYFDAPKLASQPLLSDVAINYPSQELIPTTEQSPDSAQKQSPPTEPNQVSAPKPSKPEKSIPAPTPKPSPAPAKKTSPPAKPSKTSAPKPSKPTKSTPKPSPDPAQKPSPPVEPSPAPIPKQNPPEKPSPAPTPQSMFQELPSAKASFTTDRRIYTIHLEIPEAGRWLLELQDDNQQALFQIHRYFSQGDNEDFWDGVLEDGTQIKPGKYKLILDNGTDRYQTQVFLQVLRHE